MPVTATGTADASQDRIPSLDGLRAVSISFVLVAHWAHAAAAPRVGVSVPYPITDLGGIGVSVFFAISGYLITGLLLREYGQSGRISLRAFYVRRAFRILPALWVFVALAAAAAPVTTSDVVRSVSSSRTTHPFRAGSSTPGRFPWRSSSICAGRP